ncbi:hypothetical protein T484DRAFT_2018823 [Baffinella frigidus]|nr:hypothetical protein T484DRAFT_2018823 [Cryptophyta sp. CCMP2293]
MAFPYENLVAAVRKGSVRDVKAVLHSGGGEVDINKHFESDGPDNHVLYTAVIFARSNIVALLLAFGALVDNKHEMWETALSYRYSTDIFLQLFHALTARLVVEHNNQLLGAPLAAAVWNYIEKGRRTKHGVTRSLLEMVLCSSTAQMLSLVLYYGIEVNPVDMPGVALNTILHNWGNERGETERYNTEKVRILIEAGAIMCPYPSDGPSLLQLAVDVDKTWNAELVRLILDTDEVHGINAESAFGDRGAIVTPLEQIVTMECNNMQDDNRTDITTQLVESGAVYARMTHSGASVLSLALKRELDAWDPSYRISMLDVLLTHMTPSEWRSPDIFLQLFHALTAQLAAAKNNQLLGAPLAAAVWHYIEQGRRTKHGVTRSVLEEVVCESTAKMLSMALYCGMEVNPADKPGVALNTILRNWGEGRGDWDKRNTAKVRVLIEAGAIMCPYPSDGPSILQLAVDVDKTQGAVLVRLVLDTDEVHGINVESAFGGFGAISTPLEQIVTTKYGWRSPRDNRKEITEQLIESGAVYTRMTHSGVSILSLTLERELDALEDAQSVSMLDVLLAYMTPSEVRMPATTSHGSLVMQAVARGGRKYERPTSVVLEKLLANGADASAVDGPSGQTPLYYLVAESLRPLYMQRNEYHNEKAVVQLLQGGADIFRENADGQNVVDLVAANASNWTMQKDTYQLLYDTAMRRQNNLEAFGMALHPQRFNTATQNVGEKRATCSNFCPTVLYELLLVLLVV